MKTDRPLFSICVVTMNRPELCCEALTSLMGHTEAALEIIVWVNARNKDDQRAYKALEKQVSAADDRFRFIFAPQEETLTPGLSRNKAASYATGAYIGFLDDDDLSTGGSYLADLRAMIEAADFKPDLICARQSASPRSQAGQGEPKADPADNTADKKWLWLEQDRRHLCQGYHRGKAGDGGIFSVVPQTLIRSGHFAHVNSLFVCRDFFTRVGGFDSNLVYEEDREFFWRLLALSRRPLWYVDHTASHHHIPGPDGGDTASNTLSMDQKLTAQLQVYKQLKQYDDCKFIHRKALKYHMYVAQQLAVSRLKQGRLLSAFWLTVQALASRYAR